MTEAVWYFDFISPFAYLQLGKFQDLPVDLEIALKPVVFSSLLSHWGNVGPAEIPPKRQFVYRFFKWQANQRGMPFTMPRMHPFNPLPPLRLALLGGSSAEVVRRIFHFIYGEGRNLDDESSINALGASLGIADAYERITEAGIKQQLKANTDAAIAAGVFGVPTFVSGGNIFWGDDATNMFLNYLRDPGLFEESEMVRVSNLPMGITRPRH
jgi:2-hydroxychromene-2-carboxylate isomerase